MSPPLKSKQTQLLRCAAAALAPRKTTPFGGHAFHFLATSILFVLAGSIATAEQSPQAIEFFENKIRPLLVDNCQSCHGGKTQWGGLRLDSRQALLQGGDSGAAVVAGSVDESELIRRIVSDDESEKMPPPDSEKQLTAAAIADLKHWIDSGAAWPESDAPSNDMADIAASHWAFQPLTSPTPPTPQNVDWGQTPVDAFIMRALEQQNLSPSPVADRRSLIRRATFDLTGLPPTAEQVQRFVGDDGVDAYPLLIDRLLDSPAYGEQWGRHWLDVARYSDTKGYVYGREEKRFIHASHYRDWVIRSFNEDLPYDRFLLLQIAADQAAPDDPAAAAAMGFLTLGRRFLGVQPDIIDDRIDVVTRGTMGLTVSCARCHDHKFDPIPTADYYSLYGVFQNCAEHPVALPRPQSPPASDELSDFEVELKKRLDALEAGLSAARTEFAKLARKRIGEYLQAQFELDKYPEQSFSQILSKKDLLPSTVRRWQKYLQQPERQSDPIFLIWYQLAQLPDDRFAELSQAALASLSQDAPAINPRVAAAFATAPSSKQEMVDRYAKLFTEVDQQWHTLVEEATQAAENQAEVTPPTQLPDPADESLRQVLYGDGSPCMIPDLPIINIEFDVDTGTCVALWKQQNAVDQWIISNPSAAPHAIVLRDREPLVQPRIFRRGNPVNIGDEVPRQFLGVVAGSDRAPFARGSGRLELAQAIASADNPLTARVWVNRVWAHHFGRGIVPTTSDFGTRAEPPSHPELLDWLTRGFIESGWSTKWLHRQIMLSSAYRQRSTGPDSPAEYAAARTADPENRLLWRMNARRLRFEELRDAQLAAAGTLDMQRGGKAVDLFASAPSGARRTIYTMIDRQSLPSVLQVFDFANPDLHTPRRSETTVPQQALFGLNHPFVADRAREIAAAAATSNSDAPVDRILKMFAAILQRSPSESELAATLAFVRDEDSQSIDEAAEEAKRAWTYGYGEIDADAQRLLSFTPLPYFSGSAWQGSTQYPDGQIGWAQINADGGHPGNDLKHAIIRRWTAPASGRYWIQSTIEHAESPGDGIRCWVLAGDKVLRREILHNTALDVDVPSVDVEQGETIDFVVDIYKVLHSDQHQWSQKITRLPPAEGASETAGNPDWASQRDFTGLHTRQLNRWEQLAQTLLLSNEFMFVD
ncbi:PSD1 and planctomycete cytochrome C domain-containing protein [Rosistilla oblonga]|uniref:PSD1 and planctomycete cytochrome C domain-containing protein n=1 Tax=Rosistilla oblonga TaxID=2527990 RepID=UPI003A9756FB